MTQLTKEEYINIRDLSFKTNQYHRNFDLIITGDSIINEYEGKVSKLRILERKSPLIIGDYSISLWNLKLGREMNLNINDVLKIHSNELIYEILFNLVNENQISLDDYDKIVFIHSFILKKEYRKKQITKEFVEYIYRNFYDEKNLIIGLTLPVQYNEEFMNYFNTEILVLDDTTIYPNEYYDIDELMDEKNDRELNEFKLFTVAQKCGFERISESYLFKFNPTKTIERMRFKLRGFKKE